MDGDEGVGVSWFTNTLWSVIEGSIVGRFLLTRLRVSACGRKKGERDQRLRERTRLEGNRSHFMTTSFG